MIYKIYCELLISAFTLVNFNDSSAHCNPAAPAQFSRKTSEEVFRVGQAARLLCPASGDKPIDLVWSVDGRRIDPHSDPRYNTKKLQIITYLKIDAMNMNILLSQ